MSNFDKMVRMARKAMWLKDLGHDINPNEFLKIAAIYAAGETSGGNEPTCHNWEHTALESCSLLEGCGSLAPPLTPAESVIVSTRNYSQDELGNFANSLR